MKNIVKTLLLSVSNIFRNQRKRLLNFGLRNRFSGYVAILICVCLPVVFICVKYMMDQSKFNAKSMLKAKSGDFYKQCANEAALEVARNWNPGLTLNAQKETVLKVADDVYNANPAKQDSALKNAVPGIDHIDEKTLEIISLSPSSKTIEYESSNEGIFRYEIAIPKTLNQYVILSKITTDLQFLSDRADNGIFDAAVVFDDQTGSVKKLYLTCNEKYVSSLSTLLSTIDSGVKINSSTKKGSIERKKRVNANDTTVQVTLSNDRIKVLTDKDIGYAIPAQCNVDIVLSIPTNGAACNPNNQDAASDTAGAPASGTAAVASATITETRIYQISQAYRKFLKDNFFHIRGVNVGLIPYSGKVSLASAKSRYTQPIPAFVSANYQLDLTSKNKTMRQIFLYSTKGAKDAALTQPNYDWNSYFTGCPIMCRRGKVEVIPEYGNNIIATGNELLSLSNPSSADYYYRQMNLNPCYLGYANLLNMKCERDCTKYLPNPYPIMELTADVTKVYEYLNGMHPIYDICNVSNLLFIPLEWGNNLFQDWTNDPKVDANNDVLSRSSKTTLNRKKAVILLVNKPDFFEPGELTYLGFDNDLAEVPMAESDKIDFSQNYTASTSRKFLDGSNYDGTIQGPKKILKYTTQSGNTVRNSSSGYYECSNGTGRLTFPVKGRVKIVVTKSGEEISWKNKYGISNLRNTKSYSITGIAYGNGKYVVVESGAGRGGSIYATDDFNTWTPTDRSLDDLYGIIHDGEKFVVVARNGYVYTSIDGITWTLYYGPYTQLFRGISHKNGLYIAVGNEMLATSNNGTAWIKRELPSELSGTIFESCVCGGNIHVAVGWSGSIIVSEDNGNTWTNCSPQGAGAFYGVAYGNGVFVAVGYREMFTSSDGRSWVKVDLSNLNLDSSFDLKKVTYSEGLFVAVGKYAVITSTDGKIWSRSVIDNNPSISIDEISYGNGLFLAVQGFSNVFTGSKNYFTGILKFTNVSGDTAAHAIDKKTTFIIQPHQISDGKDAEGNYYIDFDMTNIKLVSAEVTNLNTDVVPISVTYQDVDIIDFSKGNTSGTDMSYSSTSGSTSYNSGKGLDCDMNTDVVGRITTSQQGTIALTVERNDAQPTVSLNSIRDSWESVTYSNGKWRAVSWYGDAAYSTDDGKTWVNQGRYGLNSSGGAGNYGTYGTNGNGLANILGSPWYGGSYGNGKWLAVSYYGYVAYSTDDGRTWVDQGKNGTGSNGLANIDSSWYGVSYGNGKWLAVDFDGYAAYSTDDGRTWVNQGKNGTGSNGLANICEYFWYGVSYGNNKWFAVNSYGYAAYSTDDGKTWVKQGKAENQYKPLPATVTQGWNSYGGIGYNSATKTYLTMNYSGYVAYSTDDGRTWVDQGKNGTGSNGLANILGSPWYGGSYGNGKWLAVSYYGYVAYSTDDGRTWVDQGKNGTGSNGLGNINSYGWYGGMSYGNGKWLAVNSSGYAAYSTDDRMTWVNQGKNGTGSNGLANIISSSWYGVSYGNGKWLAVNSYGYAAYSTDDGKTWVNQGKNGTGSNGLGNIYDYFWYEASYGNGKWLAVNEGGYAAYSTDDGKTWVNQGKNGTGSNGLGNIHGDRWYGGMSYGNGKWLLVNYFGYAAHSTDDGKTWVKQGKAEDQYKPLPATLPENWYNYGGIGYNDVTKTYLAVNYFGYVAYSTDDGMTWVNQGKYGTGSNGLANINSDRWSVGTSYGNGKWLAVNSYGYVAYSDDNGKTWTRQSGPGDTTQTPKYTINSQNISGRTTVSINANQLDSGENPKYYADLNMRNIRLVSAVIKRNKTAVVDDLIDFSSSTTSKNNKRYLSYAGTGTTSNGLYTIASGNGQLTLSKKGNIELTVASAIGSSNSTLQFNSGSDQSIKTVTGVQTFTIQCSDMIKGMDNYSIAFVASNIVLLKAEFIAANCMQIDISTHSRLCNWSANPVSNDGYIGMAGTYNNYVTAEGYHQLNTGLCSPYLYPIGCSGDVTVILDAKSPFIPGITMPEYTSNANYVFATGPMRLFSPIRRGSTCQYCYLKPYSATYNSKANLITTDFTYPMNTALHNSGYQKDTSTYPNTALASLTSASCSKLKSSWGGNVRVYVVKYRKQAKYKSFPFYNTAQSNVDHDYSYIDGCASSSSYVYDVTTESDLNAKLSEIAADIKSFANYQQSKRVE